MTYKRKVRTKLLRALRRIGWLCKSIVLEYQEQCMGMVQLKSMVSYTKLQKINNPFNRNFMYIMNLREMQKKSIINQVKTNKYKL